MAAFRWVYVTCKDEEEARRLARVALKRRLAACGNFFPVGSLYWWKGRIEDSREVALVLKTRASLVRRLITAIVEAHSYEVPCIDVLPVLEVNPTCAAWLAAETAAAEHRRGRRRKR